MVQYNKEQYVLQLANIPNQTPFDYHNSNNATLIQFNVKETDKKIQYNETGGHPTATPVEAKLECIEVVLDKCFFYANFNLRLTGVGRKAKL